MFLDKSAFGVRPFEDDRLALEVGQGVFLAVDVGEAEVGRGLADRGGRRAGGGSDGQQGDRSEDEEVLDFFMG